MRPRAPKPPRPRRQAPYDPFAPLTPKQMRQQAAAAVNAQIAPVIAQINAQIARQEAQGTQNIGALTRQLAAQYAGYVPAERSIYGEAQTTQRADNTALADRLNAAGANVAGNVGGQLAAIGAPAGQQTQAAGLAQVGQGAGNAQFAAGSSELARLVAAAAGAENYGAKLPGIAALAGTQQSGALLRTLENARAAQTGDLRAKMPGLTADTLQQLRTQEFNKGVARQSGILSAAKTQQQIAYENARLGLTARGQNLTRRGQDITARGQDLTAKGNDAAARQKALGNRASAKAAARKTAYTMATKNLGAAMPNPNPGRYTRKGSYIAKPGQSEFKDGTTNHESRAQRTGAKTWQQTLNAIYANIHDELRGRYGLKEPAIRALIVREMVAAGYRQPTPTKRPAPLGSGPAGVGRGARG